MPVFVKYDEEENYTNVKNTSIKSP